MLARFDSQIHQRGNLRQSDAPRNNLWLLTGLMAVLLISWLVYRYLLQPAWIGRLPSILSELLFLIEAASVITLGILTVFIGWRQRRQARQLSVLTIEEMHTLSPAAFESYVAGLFRQKGYQVRQRGRRGDRGVDLELTRAGGRNAIVQCKRYRHTVGPDIVRELFGTMIHERVHHAFLVTTADISKAAREWALSKPITLIDGQTLVQIAASLNNKSTS
jgi:restriction system protein